MYGLCRVAPSLLIFTFSLPKRTKATRNCRASWLDSEVATRSAQASDFKADCRRKARLLSEQSSPGAKRLNLPSRDIQEARVFARERLYHQVSNAPAAAHEQRPYVWRVLTQHAQQPAGKRVSKAICFSSEIPP